MDFRMLNKKINQDRFSLRRIEEILDSLGSAKYFSTLDLYRDYSREFIVTIDASDFGCGAKLAQLDDGTEMPVAFALKCFEGHELNSPPIEKEMYAIYFAIMHFRPYLFGRRFMVKTDHKPLVHLYTMKNPSQKLYGCASI